jgi:predicted PurR-regulated permease PerM
VALSLGSWWQPAAVVALYVALHQLEGYVVTPLVYGRAAEFNPVTILFSALFFGWLWGPLGVALALPMMILLRGLLVITPDTPALDALADVEGEKAKVQGTSGGG